MHFSVASQSMVAFNLPLIGYSLLLRKQVPAKRYSGVRATHQSQYHQHLEIALTQHVKPCLSRGYLAIGKILQRCVVCWLGCPCGDATRQQPMLQPFCAQAERASDKHVYSRFVLLLRVGGVDVDRSLALPDGCCRVVAMISSSSIAPR